MAKPKRRHGESHVRVYSHELGCPAWRTLSTDARALLIEMRAMFNVKAGNNRIFMSARDMQFRCNLTQRAAARARDELLDRGWITMVEHGSFNRKVRHATVFALENEPPSDRDGAVPSKLYMRWSAPITKKHGSGIDYRSVAESTTEDTRRPRKKAVTVAESTTDSTHFCPITVVESTTQIPITKGCAQSGLELVMMATLPGVADHVQKLLILGWVLRRSAAS